LPAFNGNTKLSATSRLAANFSARRAVGIHPVCGSSKRGGRHSALADAAVLIKRHDAIHEVTQWLSIGSVNIRLWEGRRFMLPAKRLKISWKVKIQP
jgi:hypothetical protein